MRSNLAMTCVLQCDSIMTSHLWIVHNIFYLSKSTIMLNLGQLQNFGNNFFIMMGVGNVMERRKFL